MTEEELKFFKTLLLEKKGQAHSDLEEFERVSRSDTAQESSEDRSAYSLHMADRGTDAMEREKNLLFAQREGSYIDYVDEALQRVDGGTYGVCRVCEGEIARNRLEAVPTATQCITCKSQADEKKSES
ncbi:MAG TPA: transcriptional regulator [Candidatus Latescibacteria bacterium]|jgi:RNA polymerase-binding protein DksA|nr:transcriptional regulator [Candidatus Latescibacterota bacterium]|tara:strand:- start:1139 stop:1522 length:384 start_codon:yes stop_codon:yes gene_type:complete